jgi:hypothetical protein
MIRCRAPAGDVAWGFVGQQEAAALWLALLLSGVALKLQLVALSGAAGDVGCQPAVVCKTMFGPASLALEVGRSRSWRACCRSASWLGSCFGSALKLTGGERAVFDAGLVAAWGSRCKEGGELRCGRQKGRTRLRAGLDRRGIQRPSHILKLDGHTNTKSVHILSHLGRPFRGVTACPPFSFKAGRKIGPEQDPPLDLYYQPIKDFTHFFRLNVFFPFHPHRVSYIFLSFSYSLFSPHLFSSFCPFSLPCTYFPINTQTIYTPGQERERFISCDIKPW